MTLDELITTIIKKQSVASQEDLTRLLKARGHEVTQSTLSRHLRSLGAQKRNGRYVIEAASPLALGALSCVLSPPNLVVVHTRPGHAHAVGSQLDTGRFKHIAGTIAGDDTLFVAVTDPKHLRECQKQICELFDIEV